MNQNLSRINRIVVGAVGLTAAGLVLGGGVASAQDTIPGIDDINNTGTFVPDLTITPPVTAPIDQVFTPENVIPPASDGVTGELLPGGGVEGTFTNVDEATGGQSSLSVDVTPSGIGGFGFGSTEPNGNTFEAEVSPSESSIEFGFPLD